MSRTRRKSISILGSRSSVIMRNFGRTYRAGSFRQRFLFWLSVIHYGNYAKQICNSQLLGKTNIDGKDSVVPSRMKRDWNRWYRRTNKYRLNKDGEDFVDRPVRRSHIWECT